MLCYTARFGLCYGVTSIMQLFYIPSFYGSEPFYPAGCVILFYEEQ